MFTRVQPAQFLLSSTILVEKYGLQTPHVRDTHSVQTITELRRYLEKCSLSARYDRPLVAFLANATKNI